MTETTTTTGAAGAEEDRPRCRWSSKADHPCWREATERVWHEDPEPFVCTEHYRLIQLGQKVEELLGHLDKLGAWIATWDDPSVGETRLQYHAFTARERLVEELWSATVEAEAAEDIADQGPDETPLTPEQAKRRAKVVLCSHALSDARVLFEDLQAVPEEAFGSGSRWHLAAALHAVGEDVNAEFERVHREIGRREHKA